MKVISTTLLGPLSTANQTIDKVSGFIDNPTQSLGNFLYTFFTECLETITLVSYEPLLIAGLIGLVLWVFGWKKGKNWGIMCPAIYVILQIIGRVLCTK